MAGFRDRHAADGPPALGGPPPSLHRARQAGLAETAERGAARSARRVPPDARLGLLLDARLVHRLLPRDVLAGIPGTLARGRPGGFRRSASRARPDERSHDGPLD